MQPYLYEQLNVRILILFIWRDQFCHFDSGFINVPLNQMCHWVQGGMAHKQEKACSPKESPYCPYCTSCSGCSDGRVHATSAWGAALFWFGPWAQLSGVQHALTVTLRPKITSKEEREELQTSAPVSPTLPPHTLSLSGLYVLPAFNHFSASPAKKKKKKKRQ